MYTGYLTDRVITHCLINRRYNVIASSFTAKPVMKPQISVEDIYRQDKCLEETRGRTKG